MATQRRRQQAQTGRNDDDKITRNDSCWRLGRRRSRWRAALRVAGGARRRTIRARTSASSARSRPAAAPTCWCATSPRSCGRSSSRTVIVENKAGAGGNIATEYVARAKPDGYTIYVHAGTAVAANQQPVQEAAGRRGARHPRRRDHQPPAVHARGRRQEPVQDRRRPDRGDEEEGRQGELRLCGADRPHHGRALQATRPASRRSRSTTGPRRIRSTRCSAASSTSACTIRCSRWRRQREGRLRILAVSTGKRLDALPGPCRP